MVHTKTKLLKIFQWCPFILIAAIYKLTYGLDGCRDENNLIIPYFVLYKPSSTKTYYVKYANSKFMKGKHELSSPKSVIGQTVKPLFETSKEIETPLSFAVWNDDRKLHDDEDAGENNDDYFESSASSGHSKGILAFNNASGFLLSHSFPRLGLRNTYEFPENGVKFAQMAVCVTLTGKIQGYRRLLYDILDGLNMFNPKVVKIKVGDDVDDGLQKMLARLGQIAMARTHEPIMSILDITPSKLFRVHFFSRTEMLDNLYSMRFDAFHALTKHYKTDMIAQTWNEGGWKSDCKHDYQVENVMRIGIGNETNTWSTSQDHSKWAIGTNQAVVCMGDLNRHPNTMARGGLFLCTMDRELYDIFHSFPKEIDECNLL